MLVETFLTLENLGLRLAAIADGLHGVNTEEEVLKFIARLQQLEREVDNHLDEKISKQSATAEVNNLNLDLAKTELLTSLSLSSSLIKILSDSSYLAKKLTYKVKFLDYERLRVSKTKEFVQNIITLKKNIILVHESFEKNDWDTVSKSINVILHDIPSDILHKSKFADIVIPTSEIPERPETLVKNWIHDLRNHYVREFKNAVQTKDIVKLTNFFSYFPMIGEGKVGLNCYADFINNIISDQSRSLLVGAPKDKLNFYSAASMKLFEIVSKIINQHSKVIIKYYDNDSMTTVISKIQREVDSQAGLISDTFWDARKFDKIIHDINSYNFPFLHALQSSVSTSNYYSRSSSPMGDSSSNANSLNNEIYEDPIEQLISVVEIGDYINEIATLLNRWSLYCRFIAIKWASYTTNSTLQLPQPLIESSFLTKIEVKLLPCLETLTSYYLKKSVEKSFKLEELPDISVHIKPFLKNSDKKSTPMTLSTLEQLAPLDTPPISSIVEDLVIIMNIVFTNAIETGQPILLKNVVNNSKKVLNTYFFKILLTKLRDFQPRQGTNLLNINSSNSSLNGVTQNDPNRRVITGNLSSLRNASDADKASAPPGVLSNMLLRGASTFNSLGINDEFKLTNCIIYLNSVSMFRNYINKLMVKLTNYNNSNEGNSCLLENNYAFGKDQEKLKNLIENPFMSSINKVTDSIIKDYATLLFNQIFKTKIKSILNDFFSYNNNYLIDSSATSESNTEIQKFVKAWLILIKPYYRILATEVFAIINKLIVSLVVEIMEKKIWLLNKKINLLGVLKLEKDVSMIINEVTRNNYTLREHFIRITQIIMIMGFDDENEEQDMDWILTNNERRKARYLRIDRN